MQLNMCMLCRLIRLRCSCLREAKQWYLLCAAQKQAAQQHAGVPLWCSKAPGSRRALLQQPSGVGPPQNAVVDMTQSPLEATMMAPPSDSGQAHIESGDGTAVTYVPDTPARRLQAAQNPPTVVDMTNSAIEATMMAPPSSNGQAHIEDGDGTAITYVPDTPARRLQAVQGAAAL